MIQLKCIIIEDEPLPVELMSDYIGKISFLDLKATFKSAIDALQYIHHYDVDLILLDIGLPDINGIQFLKSLQKDLKIIITSAYPGYAVEAFDLNVSDYVVKPIRFERFLKAVNKVYAEITTLKYADSIEPILPWAFIFVKTDYKVAKIKVAEILYIESRREYIDIYTFKGKIVTMQSLKNIEQKLPKGIIMRVHKSFMVAIEHIDIIERHQVRINNNLIPLGETYRSDFMSIINGRI